MYLSSPYCIQSGEYPVYNCLVNSIAKTKQRNTVICFCIGSRTTFISTILVCVWSPHKLILEKLQQIIPSFQRWIFRESNIQIAAYYSHTRFLPWHTNIDSKWPMLCPLCPLNWPMKEWSMFNACSWCLQCSSSCISEQKCMASNHIHCELNWGLQNCNFKTCSL